ncbi:MAG: acyl-CoA dehydrogenase family protein [Bacteroidales bacterium]|nr:acyl-CoA dehydrogenase family protein [Bacteroidales bacterium]
MENNFYSDNKSLKFYLDHPMMKKCVDLKENNYADKGKYDYAPADFEDALDSYDKVLEIVGEICAEIIAPNAEEVDAEGPKIVNNEVVYARGTQQNHDALTQAGLYGMSLPRKYDGLNFSMVPYVMAAELTSRADAGFGNIWGLQDCAETIHEFASEELKNKFLPQINAGETCSMDLTEPDAGSDLQAVQLKATWDEKSSCWRLNGVKRFITNGGANIKLVLARSEEGTTDGRGLSYFVFDRRDGGLTIRRLENKMGIKGSPTAELVFTNAPAQIVGDRRLGLIKYVMSLMNGARLGVGAQSVGLMEAAYREAFKYAQEREQYKKTIINFPAVYEMLASMRTKTDAGRTILYETSRYVDLCKSYDMLVRECGRVLTPEEKADAKLCQRNADMLTPMLKMFTSEWSNQVCYDSQQVHAGSGFMKDYPIERMYRDARITTIYEGTSQLQAVAAIRHVVNGNYLKLIRENYEVTPLKADLEYLRKELIAMTARYETAVKKVQDANDGEYLDFHARRLVEMAGYIIMGYLLLIDANRCDCFTKSATLFVRMGKAEIAKHEAMINDCAVKDLTEYK